MKPLWVSVLACAALVIGVVVGRWSMTLSAPPAAAPVSLVPSFEPGQPMGRVPPRQGSHEPETVQGTILEVIQVPTYTYLRLTTSNGEAWAAVESNPNLKSGEMVTIEGATMMQDFESKTLNRTFARIYFGREKAS